MVRLVFRPYTQIPRWICTSQSLRASTRVSPGFALLRHSSPSFGSQHVCSHSNLSPEGSWSVDSAPCGSYLSDPKPPLLSLRTGVCHPCTRIYVRLLGPCFKTGGRKAFRQDLDHACKAAPKARSRPQSQPWQEHRAITATPKCGSPPQALLPQPEPTLTYPYHARQPVNSLPKEARVTLLSFPSLSAISGTL